MDVYVKLDELLSEMKWKNVFEFTYIGNIPGNYKFKNVKHIKPCNGKISKASKENIYI